MYVHYAPLYEKIHISFSEETLSAGALCIIIQILRIYGKESINHGIYR